MKARIQNGVIVEFLQAVEGHSIYECFHPAILAQCVDFVEGMNIGDPAPGVDDIKEEPPVDTGSGNVPPPSEVENV
jgi:hypothetical protein